MIRLWLAWHAREDDRRDRGSLVVSLLGAVVLLGIVAVALSTVISGELKARHDKAFAQALTAAETGLNSMVAQVRSNPDAASFPALTGTAESSTATYSVTAAITSGVGHWLLTSTGIGSNQGHPVTRTVQEQVDASGIFDLPLFGDSTLATGSSGSALGSAVDSYDSAVDSRVCDGSGHSSSMTVPDTRMCNSSGLGAGATNGTLTMRGADLPNFGALDIDNSAVDGYSDPAATGKCGGDATVCAAIGTKVIQQPSPLTYPTQSICPTGIGADADAMVPLGGSLHSGVNVLPDGYTFNADVVANLNNLSASQVIVCFSGALNFNVTGLDGLAPLNSTPSVQTASGSLTGALSGLLADGVTSLATYTPRPPSTLVFVDTSTSPGTSTINFGTGVGGSISPLLGSGNETSLSAVFYAPNAACTASTHVDVYGALICGSVAAPSGLDVHYDTELKATTLQQNVVVSDWRECQPASACTS